MLEFRVSGLGCLSLGCKAEGVGVQGLGFRV